MVQSKMKRRTFMKAIVATLAAPTALLGSKKTVGLEHLEGELVEIIAKGKTATDICNEALEKIKTSWEKYGCKDCFRECEHWGECLDALSERVEARERARITIVPDAKGGRWLSFDEEISPSKLRKYPMPDKYLCKTKVSVEYINGSEEATVFINGKRAKEAKDGSYGV